MITEKLIWEKLRTVLDPELGVDLVSLGLIYQVTLNSAGKIHILMTLTTPGCPLAGMFDSLVKSAFSDIEDLVIEQDVLVELTFDPPWTPDMMSEEARAELGFD